MIIDRLSSQDVKIQRETMKITGPDGTEVTKQCKISFLDGAYRIETGIDLSYGEKIKIQYQVKILPSSEGKEIVNTAQAEGKNADPATAEHDIKISSPKLVSGSGKSFGSSSPKTGDQGPGGWIAAAVIAGACLVFLLRKRYNRKNSRGERVWQKIFRTSGRDNFHDREGSSTQSQRSGGFSQKV